jgi:hypothetical protein
VHEILWKNLQNVVLMSHNNGGKVNMGVADRVPDRSKSVIYADALLPQNGENVDSIIAKHILTLVTGGLITTLRVTGNPQSYHDVPMPANTFREPVILANQAVAISLPATCILAVGIGKTPPTDNFYPFDLRASERGQTV